MSPTTQDFDGLSAFFDPVAVACVLRDICELRPAESFPNEPGILPPATGAATAHDQQVFGLLLPHEVYAYWRQSGYLGSYCMSFMLRHAVTFLALAAHDRACPQQALEAAFDRQYFFFSRAAAGDCMDILAEQQPPEQRFALLGFSALGVHVCFNKKSSCRAFDFYDRGCCVEPAQGLFCHAHAREAWWSHDGTGVSTQADMFRFYGRKENLYAYEERQLEELVGRFWSRMKKFSRGQAVPERAVAEALAFFSYSTVSDLCACGQLNLRRRYAERARQLHPDLGGGHESFLRLKKNYELLRRLLGLENAAVQP